MKVPFSWLKQYVDIDVTAQELEDKLFGCGFEVEELIDLDLYNRCLDREQRDIEELRSFFNV